MAVDIETVSTKASAYAANVRSVLPVNKAYIFGSYAKGTASELSDVDICFFLDSFWRKKTCRYYHRTVEFNCWV